MRRLKRWRRRRRRSSGSVGRTGGSVTYQGIGILLRQTELLDLQLQGGVVDVVLGRLAQNEVQCRHDALGVRMAAQFLPGHLGDLGRHGWVALALVAAAAMVVPAAAVAAAAQPVHRTFS